MYEKGNVLIICPFQDGIIYAFKKVEWYNQQLYCPFAHVIEFWGGNTMKKILIVDDEADIRTALSGYFQEKHYHADEAFSGSDAIKKASAKKYDVIILDQLMPEMSGKEVLQELKKITPQSKIIMMTGFGTVHDAVESIKKGAAEYIQKPFDPQELDALVRRCIRETQFNYTVRKIDLDFALNTLSNPLRRDILRLIKSHNGLRLMTITKELSIEDHTKVVFHLRNLTNSGLINKDKTKVYHLTKEGERTYSCLKIIERHLLS